MSQPNELLGYDANNQKVFAPEVTTYDLTKYEDRSRAWFAHIANFIGGGNSGYGMHVLCTEYGLNRGVMEGWVFEGRNFDKENLTDYQRSEVLRTRRNLEKHAEDFNALASNDPRWAELNVMGAKK